jgi:hypothetical protein
MCITNLTSYNNAISYRVDLETEDEVKYYRQL